METKRSNISDTFVQSTCSVCGSSDINQYFSINDNFIEYCGVFYSFRDILAEALDFHIHERSHEMCLDCKDKVIKFYHFKRKVKEVQRQSVTPVKQKTLQKLRKNKIVHNIVEIVENYTEKCSISSIQIDVSHNKLIIESRDKVAVSEKAESRRFEDFDLRNPQIDVNAVSNVKNEPRSQMDEKFFNEDSLAIDDDGNSDEALQHSFGDSSEPGTSSSFIIQRLKSRKRHTGEGLPEDRGNDEPEHFEKWRTYQEKRRRRMELLKLPDNHDLYERHKAQARERTRRYRAKLRQQKLLEEASKRCASVGSKCELSGTQGHDDSFPSFFQYAEVKLEEVSDDDDMNFA